jgi:hypothetical protein
MPISQNFLGFRTYPEVLMAKVEVVFNAAAHLLRCCGRGKQRRRSPNHLGHFRADS